MDEPRGIASSAAPSLLTQYRYMLRALAELRVKRSLSTEAAVLHYRLDPGERGVLSSATPSQSQQAVTNQEESNVHRLSAEAQARGEDVVGVNVTYQAAMVDGKLVLTAGHTEVASVRRSDGKAAEEVYQANRDAAQSVRNLDLGDDASLRSLSGGLTPAADEQP